MATRTEVSSRPAAHALFTIIGSPVVQVVAPSIFNRLFAEYGHDAVLVAFDLRPGGVGAFFDAMRHTENFRGSFVTVPHKQEAARHMDELMSRARLPSGGERGEARRRPPGGRHD